MKTLSFDEFMKIQKFFECIFHYTTFRILLYDRYVL